ncbi:MAG: TylF/MycF family methyltransferase [Actinomycetota bacterium]|nr:TylF/MycF family methyltransferase [Actinomycetota bacterium]
MAPEPSPNHWALINRLLVEIAAADPQTRANYTWPILHAAAIAARTSRPRISVLELGVAGGSGLVAMERAATAIESRLGVGIDVYGFDTGSGLPAPVDPRDVPFVAQPGYFPMDEERLRARLHRAELVLGDVAKTVPAFMRSTPAPVGFVSFDLDYYSSTRDALALLTGDWRALMPRIMCYFDDTHGYPWGDFNGARLAINEFNAAALDRKVAQLYGLKYILPGSEREQRWPEAMYLAHSFDHPAYSDPEGTELVTRLDLR